MKIEYPGVIHKFFEEEKTKSGNGIGLWGGKFRIGTRSEYVVITLK